MFSSVTGCFPAPLPVDAIQFPATRSAPGPLGLDPLVGPGSARSLYWLDPSLPASCLPDVPGAAVFSFFVWCLAHHFPCLLTF